MKKSTINIKELINKLAPPKKVKFKELASRITGFSIPVFGVSWNPTKSERNVIRELILFLEDRRALYNPYNTETWHWVSESILKIREELNNRLKEVGENSESAISLRIMRSACRNYLDKMELYEKFLDNWEIIEKQDKQVIEDIHQNVNPIASLSELRIIFGMHIAKLCSMYGIDLEGKIISILPPELQENSE